MLDNYSNIRLIKRLNPVRTLLLSFFVWLVMFISAPLEVKVDINWMGYILMVFSVLSFILGFYLFPKKRLSEKKISNYAVNRQLKIVMILGGIGIIVKILDRFVIRGVSLASNYFENREIMEAAGGNAFGIISAMLISFNYIPLFILWRYKLKVNKITRILIFILFFSQTFDAIFLGQRSVLFLMMLIFALYLLYFKKITLTLKKMFVVILALIGVVYLMNYIYIERTKLFAGENTYDLALNVSNFNYTVTADKEFKRDFKEFSDSRKSVSFAYINTIQYFTHGMIEYSYLYENFNKNHSLGTYTFLVYSRFLNKIVGNNIDLEKVQNLTPRPGVYSTLFGPLFIDFGWFTILFMFIFGRYSRKIYRDAIYGVDASVLIYFYIIIVLLFAPVFNFINGSSGLFVFTSFVLFKGVNRIYLKRSS